MLNIKRWRKLVIYLIIRYQGQTKKKEKKWMKTPRTFQIISI